MKQRPCDLVCRPRPSAVTSQAPERLARAVPGCVVALGNHGCASGPAGRRRGLAYGPYPESRSALPRIRFRGTRAEPGGGMADATSTRTGAAGAPGSTGQPSARADLPQRRAPRLSAGPPADHRCHVLARHGARASGKDRQRESPGLSSRRVMRGRVPAGRGQSGRGEFDSSTPPRLATLCRRRRPVDITCQR